MININGKAWHELKDSDIQSVISSPDIDESFFFEFKADDVSSRKLAKAISAFANTYGGYIFIGISDTKGIEGCSTWTEQRIHTTVHDSLTPTPSFDVKKFTVSGAIILVIKVDEGDEPPYITSEGKIYERLSSGSFPISDSSRLSLIYRKREMMLTKMEKAISIDPVSVPSNNIYGYIDIGFAAIFSDRQKSFDAFNTVNLREIISPSSIGNNLIRVGHSIVYTPGGLSINDNQGVPAHLNNFIEIMADGSVRLRLLLHNNNPNDMSVNMIVPASLSISFKEIYTKIMGALYPDCLVYAKKYESLTVFKQFHPVAYYDEYMFKENPDFERQNEEIFVKLRDKRDALGVDTVVTSDRIPKTGLYTIDKRTLQEINVEYTAENIIEELFRSPFLSLGFPID